MVNDLLDIETDRRNPKKRLRPFASGEPLRLPAASLRLSCFSPWVLPRHSSFPAAFSFWMLLYLGSTLSYSLYLKRIALVDVVVLSGLYTLRLLAGGATSTNALISHWLAGFAIFLFLSLAIGWCASRSWRICG